MIGPQLRTYPQSNRNGARSVPAAAAAIERQRSVRPVQLRSDK